MEMIVRVCAAAALLVVILGVVLQAVQSQFQPVEPEGLERGFHHRGLAMELAKNPHEVQRILGEKNQWNREVMRQQQVVDFAFIATYWMLFTLTAVLLAERNFSGAKALAGVATLCGTVAALCDVWEDVFIIKITRVASLDDSIQTLISSCRQVSLTKWALTFITITLLSSLFWRAEWKTLSGLLFWTPGVLLPIAGIWGFIALFRNGAVERPISVMALGSLALAVVYGWSAFFPVPFLKG